MTLVQKIALMTLVLLMGCGDSPTAPTDPTDDEPTNGTSPPAGISGVAEWRLEDGGNGHRYVLSLSLADEADHLLSWTEAKTRAESLMLDGIAGHLVTITSAEENAFIVDNVLPAARTPAALIGGFQPPGSAEPDGGWQWVTGEPFAYTNWAPLEPNEAVPGADFIVFTAEPEPTIGTWNDVTDVVSIYVVEFDVIPF